MKDDEFIYNAKRSLGFTWTLPADGLHVLKADDAKDALFTFHKYRVEHVRATLRTLEHIPCTYAQTRNILDGKATSGLSTRQLRAIENYGQACERLVDMIDEGRFKGSKENLCELHSLIGKDEAKHCGLFRGHQVFIEHSHYIPPKYEYLDGLFAEGKTFLDSIECVQEKALCTFLFLSRSQFFSDCNKRTANLVMNGILMENGFHPLNIDSEHFVEKMANFYETANATEIIEEINSIAKKQYHIEGKELEQQGFESSNQQHSLVSVTSTYTDVLYTYLHEKQSQVERIETALQSRIKDQQALLKQTTANRPGMIASLWKGTAWKQEQQAQQTRLETLERSLSRVKKLRIDGKRLEAFAEKKLRRKEPELTAKRDERVQQLRKQTAHEQSQERSREQGQSLGRGLTREIER